MTYARLHPAGFKHHAGCLLYTSSGGTGTSSVTLSSTADGSIGGDPAATKMSVTVPTVLPIAVGTDGTVSTATDAKIVNNSFGAVKVNSVSIEAAQG